MNKKIYIFLLLALFSFFTVSVEARQNNQTIDDILFQNEQIMVSNIYPNPAVHSAVLKYTLHNPHAKAKVIVRSVLGQVVGEYNLDAQQQILKIDVENLVSGMYFYTLSVDEKNLMTKKFLVKK